MRFLLHVCLLLVAQFSRSVQSHLQRWFPCQQKVPTKGSRSIYGSKLYVDGARPRIQGVVFQLGVCVECGVAQLVAIPRIRGSWSRAESRRSTGLRRVGGCSSSLLWLLKTWSTPATKHTQPQFHRICRTWKYKYCIPCCKSRGVGVFFFGPSCGLLVVFDTKFAALKTGFWNFRKDLNGFLTLCRCNIAFQTFDKIRSMW